MEAAMLHALLKASAPLLFDFLRPLPSRPNAVLGFRRCAPLAACLLLAGCLEDLEHPAELRFDTVNVSEAPEPVQFTARNLSDEVVTVRLSSWAPEWLTLAEESVTIGPGGTATVEIAAAACEEGGRRESALAVSAGGGTALVRALMDCTDEPDARFGDVAAHQGARIGPTEFSPRLEIPVVNDRPGAFRAEVLANFEPTAHVEVEAVVLGGDGKPVPGLSPLQRLREPVAFEHDSAPYAAVHEFKAPSEAFAADVEVVLRIDPEGELEGDVPSNNEAHPLKEAPRLPEPLPSFVFHLVPVTMTIRKDGQDHHLTTDVPDCPAGCLSGALDMLPLPVELVEVREHPSLDVGLLEWSARHDGDPWGMTGDVSNAIWNQVEAEGSLVKDMPSEQQMVIALVPNRESVNWQLNSYAGLAGTPILIMDNQDRNIPGYTEVHHEEDREFSNRAIIAHEVGHNFGAFHAWVNAEPICRDSRYSDPDFPYFRNGTTYAPFISGDPDGGGPLRIRPAYARLGTAGRVFSWSGFAVPPGFLNQKTPTFEIMACGSGVEDVQHLSDYNYLLTLHGVARAAGASWVHESCLEWRPSAQRWVAAGEGCPWLVGGGPKRAAATTKIAASTARMPELRSSPLLGKSVYVSGYVDASGRFLVRGARAKLGDWPSMRQPTDGADHVLIAYDNNGMVTHEQPIRLLPAFHAIGIRSRFEAIVPGSNVARVEVRDSLGALMLSRDVSD